MITRTEAERVAASIHVVRPDWPVASLVTLISRDLADWPLMDIYVGLAHVAIERTADGTDWLSRTPARVKEPGPWRRIDGLAGPDAAARERAARERQQRLDDIRARTTATSRCEHCDEASRLPSGAICDHTELVARLAVSQPYRDAARQAIEDARTRRTRPAQETA